MGGSEATGSQLHAPNRPGSRSPPGERAGSAAARPEVYAEVGPARKAARGGFRVRAEWGGEDGPRPLTHDQVSSGEGAFAPNIPLLPSASVSLDTG